MAIANRLYRDFEMAAMRQKTAPPEGSAASFQTLYELVSVYRYL
jgi:hypothetical protein